MTLQVTAPALISSESPATLSAASASLLDLAAKTAAKYKALVDSRNAMALQTQGQPVDEEQFFVDVQELSMNHATLEQSIRTLGTQSDPKIKQVASHLRGVLNGDVPAKAMDTIPSAPALKPTAVESAENAYSALAYHLESESTDELEKEQLGLNLFNALQEVKKNDDPRFRKSETYQSLLQAYDSVMQKAFAPKVPEALEKNFTNVLAQFSDAAEEITAAQDPVQTYINTQLQEKLLRHRLPELKKAAAKDWNKSLANRGESAEGTIAPENLFFKHKVFGQINTDLSRQLEALEAPFNCLLDQQYEELLPYLDTHYTAHPTKGDGNCLCHSIGFLTKESEGHVAVRKKITQHMLDNPDLFAALIKERIGDDLDVQTNMPTLEVSNVELVKRYVAYMEQNGVWGGKPELQAFSNIEERPIIALQKGKIEATISFFPTKGKLKTRVPFMILNSGGHFEPLIKARK